MSFSNTTETAILNLIYKATAWANYADNAASTPETNIVTALATADYTDTGTMSSNEVAYTDYARVNVARGAGFTVTNDTVVPAANIDFPAGTGGSGTVTHFAFGKSGGGAAAVLNYGTVTPNIVTGNGVTPRLSTATSVVLN